MAEATIADAPRPVTLPNLPAPLPAIARILSRYDRQHLECFVEVAVGLLDVVDGDPDLENATDLEDDHALSLQALAYGSQGAGCAVGDPGDISTTEWLSRGRHKDNPGVQGPHGSLLEDDEDDNPDTGVEDDPQGFDPEEDFGIDDVPHDQDTDMEIHQLVNDVPMLPVVTAEHNIFTDKRVSLGLSNLTTSFQTNGSEVRSADTGALLVTRADGSEGLVGSPV